MRIACWLFLFVPVLVWGNPKINGSSSGLKVKLIHVVNGEPLKMNAGLYTNANGDSFMVSMFKYYLTDFALTGKNGKIVREEESFHLVSEAKAGTKDFTINVPDGEYTNVSFTIGVDSIYNVSGAQGGALDPLNAMFWDWNTGYIMAKFEGSSNKAPEGNVVFHIGGFAGKNSVLKRVSIPLTQDVKVSTDSKQTVFIKADLAEWFRTPNIIDFSTMPGIMMEGPEAVSIADNYADMFSLDHIEQ